MLESFFARRLSLVFRPDISRVTFLVPYNPVFSRLPMVYEWTNSCFRCWRQLRRKLKCQITTMSPETAEAVRGLLNVCGDTNEVQPTQLANRGQSQGVSGAARGRRCCMRIIEARKAPVLWARRDKHVRIRWPPCAVKTAPVKKRDQCKKRGTTLACFLTSCIYARVLCILAYCFDGGDAGHGVVGSSKLRRAQKLTVLARGFACESTRSAASA